MTAESGATFARSRTVRQRALTACVASCLERTFSVPHTTHLFRLTKRRQPRHFSQTTSPLVDALVLITTSVVVIGVQLCCASTIASSPCASAIRFSSKSGDGGGPAKSPLSRARHAALLRSHDSVVATLLNGERCDWARATASRREAGNGLDGVGQQARALLRWVHVARGASALVRIGNQQACGARVACGTFGLRRKRGELVRYLRA